MTFQGFRILGYTLIMFRDLLFKIYKIVFGSPDERKFIEIQEVTKLNTRKTICKILSWSAKISSFFHPQVYVCGSGCVEALV